MSSDDVNILSEPKEFYQHLLDMVHRAQSRIFLSSLYIGSEEDELIEALHSALRNNSSLHVYLLLDFNRSTRPGPSSTISVLTPILRDFPDRVHISLFKSPKLRGVVAKLVPPRFNEGWGTWHAKVYGADDEVMISGANLNTTYFTNRQDRYIHFKAQPTLAEYCFSFLQTFSAFSYKLLPPTLPDDDDVRFFWPDPQTKPEDIQAIAETAIRDFQAAHTPISQPETDSQDDVLIFPIIQAGQFNIREEEKCLSSLFKHLSTQHHQSPGFKPLIDLTSGYFALYKQYQDHILQSALDCRIVVASPKANGFYGSKGVSGRIPEGYTFLEKLFMKAVHKAGRSWHEGGDNGSGSGVQLKEWERHGWTYHAKGIWLSPSPDTAPILTLFGSTNLNSRSAHLDTELSFFLITASPTLRERLREEVRGLRAYAAPWRGAMRKIRLGTRFLVGLVGGML